MKLGRITSLRGEEGVALISSVIFMSLLLSVSGTLVYYSTANSSAASYSLANQKSFSLAEAGFNEGVSVLVNSSNPSVATALPDAAHPALDTSTYPGSTISYWGSWNSSSLTWTVYGKGNVPAPTARGGNAARTVSQQVRVGAGGATVAGNQAWGYVFADNRNAPCVLLNSSVKIGVSMYLTGSLCLDSSAQILASASPLTVLGTVQTNSSASVGTSTAHLAQAHIGGGCRYGTSGAFTYPCTTTQHIWADSLDQNVGNLTKPPIDLAYWYANAMPGPQHNCTSGSFPGGFDNGDNVMNSSLVNVNLLPTTGYDCVVSQGGTTVGEIKWTPPSTFYIKGTVFIDGNIYTANSSKVDYSGRGTIYATGSIYLGSSLQFCGARSAGSCNWTTGAWDPEQKLLAWVAGTSIFLDSSIQMQGAFYAITDYTQTSSVKEQGPIVTNTLTWDSSSQAKWLPFNTLAPGMPAGSSAYTASVIPGTWSG